MGQQVDQGVVLDELALGALLVGGEVPVGHVGHAVLLEQLEGVVAEAGVQVGQAAGFGRVGAEFEDPDAVVLGFGEGGVIGRGEEGVLDAGDQHAVLVGFLVGLLPSRVIHEALPGSVTGGLVRVGEEVDQFALGVLAGRHEVAEIGHAVLGEQRRGVITEAGVQGVELAFGGVVDAHLEDTGIRGLGRDGAGRKEAEGEEGEQGFHVI